jgi:membrane-bound serine protease (ClpP class)
MRNLARALVLALAAGSLVLGGGTALGAPAQPRVVELRLNGVVDPFTADYVRDGIAQANDRGADAVLLTIDTPGGLDSSMREIIQAVGASDVPVIGYVSPSGARAASAGTFVLLACPVAAMAPGTNVGAAHPVGVSGAIESEKVTNDAVALIRSLAQKFGRNADWAEQAVRDSRSSSADEALRLGVIDLISPSVPSLLETVDGRRVEVANGQRVTLHTAGATVQTEELGPLQGFVHELISPDLAFVFFWLGLALIVAEFFVPGGVVGVIGGVLLVLSFVALGMLPFQIVGIVLLLASFVFFVLELKHPGLGAPAVAGVVSLVLGGLLLFDRSVPNATVSPFVIVPIAMFAAAFFAVAIRTAVKMRRGGPPRATREEVVVGRDGVVVRRIEPRGVVQIGAEQWSAESDLGPIAAGTHVRVVRMHGLRAVVAASPLEDSSDDSPEAAPTGREGGTT